jgi:NADH-quinone oxidoreductase subunit I
MNPESLKVVTSSEGKEKSLGAWYFLGILVGLKITFSHLLRNLFYPKQRKTLNYPEQQHEYSPRFKGNHVLTVKKDGSLRCTACMLCATACPAECITIEAAEHPDPKIEKYPIRYEIDMLRCVFCGYCEEACPVDAVRMGPEWQTPDLADGRFIYDIKRLAYRPQLKGGILSVVDEEERHKAGL